MHHSSGSLGMTDQGCAQASNIEGSGVISGPIPATLRIRAGEPGSPIVDCGTMCWGCVGICGLATPWAGMRSMARLLPFQANAGKETLVTQHAPQFAPHLGGISPISPASFDSPSPTGRLHRFERLACNQFTAKRRSQHQQHIRCEMRQIIVPRFILAPTAGDLPLQHS